MLKIYRPTFSFNFNVVAKVPIISGTWYHLCDLFVYSFRLLHTFFQKCPKKEDLSVTYLVIGLPKNKNSYQVSIVEGKDLEKLEMDLETITSKHIYSIQKCFELTDLNVLYAAQKEESVELIPKG